MSRRRFLIAIAFAASMPSVALAGMPTITVTFTDMAEIRLQNISFFLVGFLLCAFLIKLLWNWLAKDWQRLPRIGYGRALVITAVWGLVFVLVLTMISGARELMTPAAWERDGRTFKVAQDKIPEPAGPTEPKRRERLEELRAALWKYANGHEGKFPAREDVSPEVWVVPAPQSYRYYYAAGRRRGETRPLAWEPQLFGESRLVLFADGQVKSLDSNQIDALLAEGNP